MNKAFYSFLCNFLFCFGISHVYSQVNDAGLWASINLEKKMNQKFSLNLTEELRFNENISELGMAFTELEADFKFYKSFSFAMNYRFAQKKQVDNFYSMRHRFGLEFSYKHKIKKLSIALTEKYQWYYSDIYSSENGKVPDRYLRTKLQVKFNLEKKYTPYVSAELFYFINNPTGGEINNTRYIAGFEYEFNKKMSVDLYYLINKEINVNDALTSYVNGIEFNYSF
jgi:hypothetical protein